MTKTALKIAVVACLAASSLTSLPALALDNIVRPYQSARSAGMGGVRITTGLYDENFFGNPARVTANPTWKFSLIDIMAESSTNTFDTIGDILGDKDQIISNVGKSAGENNHGRVQTVMPALYIPRLFGGKNSIAIGVITSTQFDIDLRKNYAAEPVFITDIGPAITFGRTFLNDRLSVGATAHATYRLATRENFTLVNLIQGQSPSPLKSGGDGAHIDLDLGTTYEIPYHFHDVSFTPAITVNNVLGGKYSNLGTNLLKTGIRPRAQPRSFGAGIAARKPKMWKFTDAVLAFEITDVGNNPNGSMFRTVHLGYEMKWTVLRPRLGINQGYLTGGLGIDLKFLEIDLATYGEEMSLNVGGMQDRRYAVRFALQI